MPADDELLAATYHELRRIARQRLASGPGASLVPTELVHEAYLRLNVGEQTPWESRAHFFSAAAESMRRILIDRARAKSTLKRGEGRDNVALLEDDQISDEQPEELLELDVALAELEVHDSRLALMVKLRYFAGLSVPETAATLEVAERTIFRDWALAKSWLRMRIESSRNGG